MICDNCGSNNPDNNGFCYSCGAPLYAPVKKKSKKTLIISAIVLVLIAIAVGVILIIPKSSPSERSSASKVSTPEDVAKKYMKALQKGDTNKIEDCYLPDMCTWLRFNQTAVINNLVDYFKNQNGFFYFLNIPRNAIYLRVSEGSKNSCNVGAHRACRADHCNCLNTQH